MATSGKIQPGDEVEAYNGDGGLVLSVDCYGQDVIVHHTGTYPKVWAARELTVVRRGVFGVRDLGAAEQNPVGWSVDEWNGLRWAYQARGWKAQGAPKEQAPLGDWKRAGSGWTRGGNDGGAHVADQSEPGVFRVLVCGTLLGSTFACPDAAREAADAYLVSQGRLDKSRAFVRLGEWEPAPECGEGYMMRRQASGHSPLTLCACGKEARESSDASAVANGWLDPSRAFRAGPTSAPGSLVGFTVATGAARPPEKYDSVPPEVARAAKPAWGEWERIGVAYVRRPSDRGAVPAAAYVDRWELGGNRQSLATDIDDAREKADAFLVARGELEAGRAFKRVGDWTFSAGEVQSRHWRADWCAAVVGDSWGVWGTSYLSNGIANGPEDGDAGKAAADAELVRRGLLAEERAFKVAPRSLTGTPTMQPGTYREIVFAEPCVTDQTTVTLANWERCLPRLLSNAPREFRDGFNRKQGPAWEAYLRGLAWVKERVQCERLAPTVREAIVMATENAHRAMGAEWVKANVREPSAPIAFGGGGIPAGGIRTLTIPDYNR